QTCALPICEGGEHSYQFVMDKRITKVLVTEALVNPLAKGQMGIVAWQERFYVLPAPALERLAERDDSIIVSWHKAQDVKTDEEDTYADFPFSVYLLW